MLKLGIKNEGSIKQHIYQAELYEDVDVFGFTNTNFKQLNS